MDDVKALIFLRAVGCQPVKCVVERRGKVYNMWADKRSRRKIISCAQLAHMDMPVFIGWLHQHYHSARLLFPEPGVYREEEI